jgi:hemoglobin/transferrin/lactoferrin receptor protein
LRLYLYLMVTLFFLVENIFPQNLLTGKITDRNNGNVIQEAIVFINYDLMDYSDKEGNYRIINIPNGTYTIKVSHLGYKSAADVIVINDSSNIKNYQLEPSPIKLDEVIVRTDRTGNYLRNSSYSELLVESEEIQSKLFNSIADVLQYEPGISLIRDGIWGTEVNIRGLSRENIVTLIDGNRIITSTDIAARLSLVDQNDIERIEVIKGASSSIYGSGATGGIVNIITKSPAFNSSYYFDGSISGGYNSVNNSSVTSGIFYSGDESWAAKLAASFRNAGNVQTPAGELLNSQFKDYSLSGSFIATPLRNHRIKTDYQKFKAEDVGIPGGSVFPGNAKVRYPDEQRELISAAYDIQGISKVLYKVSAKYAYQYIERNVENIPYITRVIPATPTTLARRVSVLKITPRAEHRSNNIDLQGNLLLAEDNNLLVGLDYWDRSYLGQRENHQLIEVYNPDNVLIAVNNRILGEKPLPDAKSRNVGIYIQDEAGLIKDKLAVSMGIRTDRIFITGEETRNPVYESINGVLSPDLKDSVIWNKFDKTEYSYSSSIGLRYSVNTNLDLTLSAGLSFRSPSLEERFQFIDQGNFIRLGNPNLKPERGNAVDLGLRFYLPEFKIVTSIFYNYFTDLVVEEPGIFQERPAFIKTNVGKARLFGFDIGTEYNIYRKFIFYGTISYVKGDDLTYDTALPEIPPLNTFIGLKTKIINDHEIDFSSNLFAKQKYVAAGEMETPGYAVFNLSYKIGPVMLSPLSLRVYSGIENIFNTRYRNHLSTTRGNLNLEPGRNIYLRIAVNW